MKTTSAENAEKRPNWRTGAPDGNRNALKHGRYTKEARAIRARVSAWRKTMRALLKLAKQQIGESTVHGGQAGVDSEKPGGSSAGARGQYFFHLS